eukprot:TRINITY_DN15361_c0_g1_i1.p1 TRINITY_DN15361_c0_g1~~TRINITY_DN15361_c0_g1_i1.p1  ORF type:complete len:249 (-),score=31.02 TRINITY_DN15361_c0_g1_i1:63-809(-)
MDAFYASVEIRDNPKLKGLPVAVGGMGMLSTASYEARKYGVRSAMPGFIAKQLCPDLIIVPTHFDKYKEASHLTRQVFAQYDPHYRSYSLDEASLHLTPYLRSHPDTTAEEVAKKIRESVFRETKVTCSVGIAVTRKLAKICSDINKPNGQFQLAADRDVVISFMKDLPVRKVSGIGKVMERILHGLNITTCGQLYEQRVVLHYLFKPESVDFFPLCGARSILIRKRAIDRQSTTQECIQRTHVSGIR